MAAKILFYFIVLLTGCGSALADPDSVYYYYQKLIALRHSRPVVTNGVYKLLDADNEKVYSYLRIGTDETLVVIANFTAETVDYTLDAGVQFADSEMVLSNYADAPAQLPRTLTLPPYGAYVYAVR